MGSSESHAKNKVKVFRMSTKDFFGTDSNGDYYENFAEGTLIESSGEWEVHLKVVLQFLGESTLHIKTDSKRRLDDAVNNFLGIYSIASHEWNEV